MRDELESPLIGANSSELAGYFNRLRRSAQKLLATRGRLAIPLLKLFHSAASA
jgi:hypothetical protein